MKTKIKKGITLIELLVYLVIVGIAVGATVGGCTVSDNDTGYIQCKAKAKKMGFESDWGMIQGCMIKVHGQWIDINKYRIAE